MNPDPTYINLLFEMLRMLRISSRFGIWASRTSAPILRCVGSWIRQVKAVKAAAAAMIVMIYSWWMLMIVDQCWWCMMMLVFSVLFETAGHCGRCFFFWVPSPWHQVSTFGKLFKKIKKGIQEKNTDAWWMSQLGGMCAWVLVSLFGLRWLSGRFLVGLF